MPIITLTSDYGIVDHRVASIKGTILSLNPEITIVDITHQIEAFNLKQTAYIVRNAFRHFPIGTVHIIAVDSFFKKDFRGLIFKVDGHYFIAPDNGILKLIFHDIKPELIHEITFTNRFDDVINFPALDIFAPAAVHLCNGGLPEVVGRPFKKPLDIKFPHSVFNPGENMIVGEVIYIDSFGNIVSNISKQFFQKYQANTTKLTIKFRNLALSHVYNHYSEFVTDWADEPSFHGKSIAIFNDVDLLELCIYKGSGRNGAKDLYGMKVGENIFVEFQK